MRIAISGSTGFIGSRLVSALRGRGDAVMAIERDAVTLHDEAGQRLLVEGIREDPTQLVEAFRLHHPDTVVHLATLFIAQHSSRDIPDLVEANVRFGTTVLEAAAAVHAPVIVASSFWQHADSVDGDANSLYAATKNALLAIARYYVRCHDLDLRDLVLFDVYGEGDPRGKVLSLLIDSATNGSSIAMSSGTQLINLLHVDDVVAAVLAAIGLPAQPGSERRNVIAAADFHTIRELASIVETALGKTIDTRWGARPDRPGEMREPWLVAPPLPGWRPSISLEDGVRRLAGVES